MEQNREIKINQLPSITWHWLNMNEAVIRVPEKMEEAAIIIEKTDLDRENISRTAYRTQRGETGSIRLAVTGDAEKEDLTADHESLRGVSGEIHITAEEGSDLTVIEKLGSRSEEGSGILSFDTVLELQENSHIHLIQVCMPSEKQTLLNKVTAEVQRHAAVSVTQLFLGSGNTYSEVKAGLLGKEADLTTRIGYFLQQEQKLDINLIADHRGEKTTCDITAEGTLKDRAQKIFRGTIDFKKGACGAKGSEVEEVLLLGDDIVNKTIPLILCAEEDVEGNHGATIGELDEETLFYLAARGIDRETAENMMARARIEKLCHEISDEETKQLVMEQLDRLMPQRAGEENADEA